MNHGILEIKRFNAKVRLRKPRVCGKKPPGAVTRYKESIPADAESGLGFLIGSIPDQALQVRVEFGALVPFPEDVGIVENLAPMALRNFAISGHQCNGVILQGKVANVKGKPWLECR
jgi:hypothetical protein